MINFTVEELKAELLEVFTNEDKSDVAGAIRYQSDAHSFDEKPFGLDMVKVESEGGEGEGDYASDTFKIITPEGERFFTIPGQHQSYDGTYMYFDSLHEVKPEVITKVEYVPV